VFVNHVNGKAEILDLSGKVAMTVQLKNEVNRIDISDLPKGVYVLRANGETRKFVKQ
jgi:predicted NAD/FAD-binding protein